MLGLGLGTPGTPPVPATTTNTPSAPVKPVRAWRARKTPRAPSSPASSVPSPALPSAPSPTPGHAALPHPQARRVSEKSTKTAHSARSRRSLWSNSHKSTKSSNSTRSKRSGSSRLHKLPPIDIAHPLSKLAEALDLANMTAAPSAKVRRANKAAIALRQLILDPPQFEMQPVNTTALVALPPSLPTIAQSPTSPTGASPLPATTGGASKGKNNKSNTAGGKGKKSFVPRLREKDVARLRTQLLKPTEAKMVIAHARSLPIDSPSANVDRAVCLDCPEGEADSLIQEAHRVEGVRRKKEKQFDHHRFSTIKVAPPPPPRLPVLLSLFSGLTAAGAIPGTGADASIMCLGLFEPASAMSLHRPLAGALPSAETLRRGFDALINAEGKVYLYEGPSHKNVHPPTDRISVYTYWWGFELALPPPTMKYLAHAKSIATSVLNLLSVIVYAVPGGTRELAPFVGVLSRFIDSEWALLKSQDRGKGVVCGATWFIPAALVARPWDFGEETIRDKMISVDEEKHLAKEPIDPHAIVRVKGAKGEAEGVVLGLGKAFMKGKRASPVLPWKPDSDSATSSPVIGVGPVSESPEPSPSVPQVPQAPHKHAPPELKTLPFPTVLARQLPASEPVSPVGDLPVSPVKGRFGWRAKGSKAKTKTSGKSPVVPAPIDAAKANAYMGLSVDLSPSFDMPSVYTPSTAGFSNTEYAKSPLSASAAGPTVAQTESLGRRAGLAVTALTLSKTLGSRTMRRLKGTLGRDRVGEANVDPFPTSMDDGAIGNPILAVDVGAARAISDEGAGVGEASPAATINSSVGTTLRGVSLKRFQCQSA